MKPVTAAGGVLYRKKEDGYEVVLIYRNDIWDLPKGKKGKGESVEECARREVAEEVGIPLPAVESFLTETYHEYQRSGQKYGKITYWYRMKIPATVKSFTPQKSEGISAIEWVDFETARQRVAFDNLKKVLQALKDLL